MGETDNKKVIKICSISEGDRCYREVEEGRGWEDRAGVRDYGVNRVLREGFSRDGRRWWREPRGYLWEVHPRAEGTGCAKALRGEHVGLLKPSLAGVK